MAPYRYSPLDVSRNEIRVVHLHAGSQDDPIRVTIEHIPFDINGVGSSSKRIDRRPKLGVANLPESWSVFETLEGRSIYFCSPRNGTAYATWQSPNATSNEGNDEIDSLTVREKTITRYEAVSYTWWLPAPESLIEVMDASMHLGTLSIGPNLHEMLGHLRRPSAPRTLWIDAISLNQADTFEKSAQLKRMGDVFVFATRVVMWLGQISMDATAALEALAYVGKQIEYSSDDYFLPAPDCTELTWWNPETAIPLNQSTWIAIAKLIRRPYSERLWVVQEIQLGGQHSLTGIRHETFIRACFKLQVHRPYIQAFLSATDVTHRLDLLNTSNREGSLTNHPSWAPAFTQSVYERYTAPANTFAASFSAAKVWFVSPNQLHVVGICHGHIKAVTGIITTYASSDYLNILDLYSRSLPNKSTVDCVDAFVCCLCQAALGDRWHDHSLTPSLKEAKNIVQQSWPGAFEIPEVYWDWHAVLTEKQQPHRFFITDRGYLGCGPPGIAIGDQVCISLGSVCPVAINSAPTVENPPLHRFMGPAYVHGLMEGQALLGPLPDSWDLIIDHRIKKSRFSFYHRQTDAITLQDPRHEALPSEWEEVDKEDEARLRFHVQHHRNKVTGKIINSDPRLLPETLEDGGVQLDTFVLI